MRAEVLIGLTWMPCRLVQDGVGVELVLWMVGVGDEGPQQVAAVFTVPDGMVLRVRARGEGSV